MRMKSPWPKRYPDICPDVLRKITKDLSMDSGSPQRYLNLRPTEYGAEEVPTELGIKWRMAL
jgi:hypothetical protein